MTGDWRVWIWMKDGQEQLLDSEVGVIVHHKCKFLTPEEESIIESKAKQHISQCGIELDEEKIDQIEIEEYD
jgi:hypothetical protein